MVIIPRQGGRLKKLSCHKGKASFSSLMDERRARVYLVKEGENEMEEREREREKAQNSKIKYRQN